MTILIVSATTFEIAPLHSYLKNNFSEVGAYHFTGKGLDIRLLISGVGMTFTAFSLGKVLQSISFDLVINAGIAGAFNRNFKLGDVVNVISERFGDTGVEKADGSFEDIFDLGLMGENQLPFKEREMLNENAKSFSFLPIATAITVNKVHGRTRSIRKISEKYNVDIESMEGAAVFLACLMEKIPFLEIRAISNYVEPRDKSKWKLDLAISNLNKVIIQMLELIGQ